jgi:hypothetical protein
MTANTVLFKFFPVPLKYAGSGESEVMAAGLEVLIHSTLCRNIENPASTRCAMYGASLWYWPLSDTRLLPHCWGAFRFPLLPFSCTIRMTRYVAWVTCCSDYNCNQNIFLQHFSNHSNWLSIHLWRHSPFLAPTKLKSRLHSSLPLPRSYILISRVPSTYNQRFLKVTRNRYCS